MKAHWLLALGAACCLSGCSKKNAAKGCHDPDLDKVISALESVDVADRPQLAGVALVEACQSSERPMPAGLSKALTEAANGPKDMRILGAMKAIMALPGLWSTACVGGLSAPQSIVAVAPAEQSAALATQCKLSARGYASDEEVASASVENAILGALAYEWLLADGTDAGRSKKLARALLGVR